MRILRGTFRVPHNGLIVTGTIRMMSSLTWEGVEKVCMMSSIDGMREMKMRGQGVK